MRNTMYYHGNCRVCKSKLYYSYSEDGHQYRRFHDTNNQKYFVIATGIGFSVQFLKRVSLDISIGNTAFSKIADIYNSQFLLPREHKLHPDILESNWIIYRLSGYIKVIQWHRNFLNNRLHTEEICLEVYQQLKNIVDDKWLMHKCQDTGCSKRMVVIDGNEKLYRYCCAKPFERLFGGKGEINSVKRCVNNPTRGNENKEGSDMCEMHFTGTIYAMFAIFYIVPNNWTFCP